MIIKSMSRKNSSYSQLLRYMEGGRHDEKFTFSHNLFTQDNSDIIKEFKHNANFFKHKKNGVMMYHEILSITRNNQLSEEQQKTLLKEITQKYISSRANNNLVYAVLHDDKDEQLHYHLMISSNEIRSEKKHRLSKYEFEHIKKELENYVLNVHPELNQEKIGKEFKVIIDRKEGSYFVGRTQFDSPDVDNEVLVSTEDNFVRIGDYAMVKITGASDFDLFGDVVE